LNEERLVDKRDFWLKISGVSGVLAPIIAFTFILLAIASYPEFSWTENALSDLGVQQGVVAVLFNSGLIIGGVLALFFALGLFVFLSEKLLGRIGAFVLVLDTLALIAVGVFPESAEPVHYYASVAFFVLFPISMLFICAAFLHANKMRMCLFTFLVAMVIAVVWIIQFSIKFGPNVAIPETVSALSASGWSIVLGVQMFKQSLRSKK